MDFRKLALYLMGQQNVTDVPKGGVSSYPKNEVDRRAIVNQIMQGMSRPPATYMPMPGRRVG